LSAAHALVELFRRVLFADGKALLQHLQLRAAFFQAGAGRCKFVVLGRKRLLALRRRRRRRLATRKV